MVKAILDNRKTVTRRLIKPQPYNVLYDGILQQGEIEDGDVLLTLNKDNKTEMLIQPYQTGDVLYVRETFVTIKPNCYYYKADEKHLELAKLGINFKWRPSIHMPKEAARIFLRVTNVRVERLRDIFKDPPGPNNQIVREGCSYGCEFIAIWQNSIKKADLDKYGWEANPWVWVIEFERISREEALENDK